MATNPNKYKPTGKKLKMAQALANPDCQQSITDLCKEVGVARTTFYDWIGDNQFRVYVDELIERYTDSELSRVWKALMRKIDKGDMQAIKLYFELKGKYKEGVGKRDVYTEEEFVDPLSQALSDLAKELESDVQQ